MSVSSEPGIKQPVPPAENPKYLAGKAKMEARQARTRELRAATQGENPLQKLVESTTPPPENIDIKEASDKISALMREAQLKNEPSTPEPAQTTQSVKLSPAEMDAAMRSSGKVIVEKVTPADMSTLSTEGMIRSENDRLNRDRTATIDPNLPPEVREAVMNAQLSGEQPKVPVFRAPEAPTPPPMDIAKRSKEIDDLIHATQPDRPKADEASPVPEQKIKEAPQLSEAAIRAQRSLLNNLRLFVDNRSSGSVFKDNALTEKGTQVAENITRLIAKDTGNYEDFKMAVQEARKSLRRETSRARETARRQAGKLAEVFGIQGNKDAINKAAREIGAQNSPEATAQLAVINKITAQRRAEERKTQALERQAKIITIKRSVNTEQIDKYTKSLIDRGIPVPKKPSAIREKYARDIISGRYIEENQAHDQSNVIDFPERSESKKPVDISKFKKRTAATAAAVAAVAVGASAISGGGGHSDGAEISASQPFSSQGSSLEMAAPNYSAPELNTAEGARVILPRTENVNTRETSAIPGVVKPGEGPTQLVERYTGLTPESDGFWERTYELARTNEGIWKEANPQVYERLDLLSQNGNTPTAEEIRNAFEGEDGNFSFLTQPDQQISVPMQ